MDKLDSFARAFIKHVRDKTVSEWEDLINRKIRGLSADRVAKIVSRSENSEQVLLEVMPDIINSVLFNFLVFIDEYENNLQVIWDEESVMSMSDSPKHELWAEGGWIDRFSDKAAGDIGLED